MKEGPISIAPKEVCRDLNHLETFFQDIVDRGGEGIILRDPDAAYVAGRSKGYLKHKVTFFGLSLPTIHYFDFLEIPRR